MTARYFFWAVILIFLGQNCVPPEEGLDSFHKESTVKETLDLGDVDLDRPIAFKVEGVDLEMELSRGEVIKGENPDWEGFCLNESQLQTITELLSDSGVCLTRHQYPKDTLCTLQYQYPFLSLFLVNGTDRADLGEKNSGCPSETLHLCEKNGELESIISVLKFNQDFDLCAP